MERVLLIKESIGPPPPPPPVNPCECPGQVSCPPPAVCLHLVWEQPPCGQSSHDLRLPSALLISKPEGWSAGELLSLLEITATEEMSPGT